MTERTFNDRASFTRMWGTINSQHPFFVAHGYYQGKPVSLIVTKPSVQQVEDWFKMAQDERSIYYDNHYSSLERVTLGKISESLKRNIEYQGIHCGNTVGPITPAIRNFLLNEGRAPA